MILTPAGVSSNIRKRLSVMIPKGTPPPVSVSTGSGTPAVIQPPTVAPPANAVDAVDQQLATSTQLMENTDTGSGIGAGQSSPPVTVKVKTPGCYVWLGGLGILLVLAFAWDRGKL